jgi:hypothetical protein
MWRFFTDFGGEPNLFYIFQSFPKFLDAPGHFLTSKSIQKTNLSVGFAQYINSSVLNINSWLGSTSIFHRNDPKNHQSGGVGQISRAFGGDQELVSAKDREK